MTIHLYGGLAEWSKAADLRSVGRLSARVRTSHPSITYFFPQSSILDIFFFLMLLDFFLIIFNFLRRESLVDHRIHRWKSTNQINAAEFQRNLLIQHLFEMGLAR